MTKKNGKVKGIQLYKCTSCDDEFLGGERFVATNSRGSIILCFAHI
jgi:transposase-like protein